MAARSSKRSGVRAPSSAELRLQADLRAVERADQERRRQAPPSTCHGCRVESDDDALANLPSDLAALYDRVKRTIKPAHGTSRTEAFLKWAEAHPPEVLAAAEPHVVQYCEETLVRYPEDVRPNVRLAKPSDVWTYVDFGSELHVSRRADHDSEDGVYVSIECNCDWEPEHGMQLVLRDGRAVSKGERLRRAPDQRRRVR